MRYRGMIGYEVTEPKEEGSDVYVSTIVEKPYRGETTRNIYNREAGEWLNDNIRTSNVIRIVADPFALLNCQNIKYCVWKNQKWSVSSIDIDESNLILTLGGAYHEQTGSDDQNPVVGDLP